MKRAIIFAALALAGCGGPWTIVSNPVAIDGDTFTDAAGQRYRLVEIDTPEFPGHCRPGRRCVVGDPYLAKQVLQTMLNDNPTTCWLKGKDVYRRTLVRCTTGSGNDIGETMLATTLAEHYRRGDE